MYNYKTLHCFVRDMFYNDKYFIVCCCAFSKTAQVDTSEEVSVSSVRRFINNPSHASCVSSHCYGSALFQEEHGGLMYVTLIIKT